MLIKCPECELQVSDQAHACPHCGFPLRPSNSYSAVQRQSKPKYKSNKRMRLPNGFGQITEIKGKKLRKPYRVMITVAKSETGKPICKLLKPEAYFETYNDAYAALVEYNRNPYDLDESMNVEELYEKWSAEYFEKLKNDSGKRTIKSAWACCSNVKTMRVKDLRARHIKGCMEQAPTLNVKFRVKSMFNIMLDYALEYELVDRNYARTFAIDDEDRKEAEKEKKDHISFTDEEMNILWENKDNEIVSWVLVQSYMGWRPQEIGRILFDDVDLENMLMTGGMKTEAGRERVVPIHPCIQDLVKKIYEMSKSRESKYFISDPNGKLITYDKYNKRFMKVVENFKLNPEHRPHDPRKQFVTMCKKYEADEYAIKYMIGHKVDDLTEKVYTDREISWLRNELEKVKGPGN